MEFKSIVATGASSCFGKGDQSGAGGFIDRYKRYHEACDPAFNNLYNLGIPGDTTSGMLLRFSDEIARRQPELVLISLGSNDAARVGGLDGPWVSTIDQFATNVMELLRQGKLLSKKTAVISAYPIVDKKTQPFRDSGKYYSNQNLQRFVETSLRICHATSTPVLDAWELFKNVPASEYLADDGLHCGDRGHEILAEALKDFVASLTTS